jgi:hypothetical protein
MRPVQFSRVEPSEAAGSMVDPAYKWWNWVHLFSGTRHLELATALIAPEPGIYRFSGRIEIAVDAPAYDPLNEEPFGYFLIARAQSEDSWDYRGGDWSRRTFPGKEPLRVQGTLRMEKGDRIFLLLRHGRDRNGDDAEVLNLKTVASSASFELQRIAD